MRNRVKTTSQEVEYDTPGSGGGGGGAFASTTNDQLIAQYLRTPPTKQTVSVVVEDRMSDTFTPGYARRRKAGEILPTNPMTATSRIRTEGLPPLYSSAVVLGRSAPYQSPYGHGEMKDFHLAIRNVLAPVGATPKSILSSKDIQTAHVAALAKLRSQGMDVLTTMAELRQTLAMIAGARAKLIDIVTAAARLLRRERKYVWTWKQLIDEFASSPWLEARFGWRILYYDLLAIRKHLDTMDEGFKFIVGRSSEGADLTEVNGDTTYIYKDEVKVGFPGLLDQSLPGYASLANTAWEVIPFSLVIDMFFDVQSRILAYSGSAVNVKEYHAAAFVSRVQKVTTITRAEMPQLRPVYVSLTQVYEPTTVTSFASSKTRMPTTVPSLDLPSFKLSLGGFKPVDLAFLTRILLSKIF